MWTVKPNKMIEFSFHTNIVVLMQIVVMKPQFMLSIVEIKETWSC